MARLTDREFVGLGGHVVAIDVTSGAEIWRTKLKGTGRRTPQLMHIPLGISITTTRGGEQMDPAVVVISVVASVGILTIMARLRCAFGRQPERRPPDPALPDPAIEELRYELDAVQERLDFVERVLLAQKEQRGRPLRGEAQPEPRVPTPS